jgi:hypothetical protein
VTDAIGAVEGLEPDHFFEVAQLSFGAADLKPVPVARDGDARRVITAILKTAQALDNDGHNLLFPNVAHNATHR